MNTGYWSGYKGKEYDVVQDEKGMQKLAHCIEANITDKQHTIERLQKELKKLKENYNIDEEIAKLIEKNRELHADLIRGFPISKEETEAIRKWAKEHEKVHPGSYECCGCKYSYVFVPTPIGVIGIVKCSCGEEFAFQKMR